VSYKEFFTRLTKWNILRIIKCKLQSLEHKPIRDFIEERITKYYKTFRQTDRFDRISPENIIYFTLLDKRERLLPVYDILLSRSDLMLALYADNYKPELWYLEIFSDKASKQNAVKHMRQVYGFERVMPVM